MSLTKVLLTEALVDFTKDMVKDLIDGKNIKKSGTKSELLERVEESPAVTKDELINFIFNNYYTGRTQFKVFESGTSLSSLDFSTIDLNSVTGCTSCELKNDGTIGGFVKVRVLGIWGYDANEHDLDEYEEDEDFDEYDFYVPFTVRKKGKYLIVSMYTLFFGKTHTTYTGDKLYLHRIKFDFQNFASKVRDNIKQSSNLNNISITNLSTGIKKLVTDKKIDCVMAACDDQHNHGKSVKKMHKGKSKSFVDRSWYKDHDFFITDKIYETNWYWNNGDSVLKKPEDYDCLKVDCESGTIIKGKKTEDDVNWFVDEIITNN